MPIPFVNVVLHGEKIGELYFLGSEVGTRACKFELRSAGVIELFIEICQRTFGNAELLNDENGIGGNVLIGTINSPEDPATMPFVVKKNFMVWIAGELASKVGRALAGGSTAT